MDRAIYVAMAGASQTLRAQSVAANNLANVSTDGFRRDLESFATLAVQGPGHASRAYGMAAGRGIDARPGPVQVTGNPLDVAIPAAGWFAVQTPDGEEAYTRAGAFQVDADGLLRTADGLPVLGNGGPIALPPYEELLVGGDGTLSVRPQGVAGGAMAEIDRLRLVNPPVAELVKGADGLVRRADGEAAPLAAEVRVVGGALEGSNVNAVEAMLRQMELTRKFELQMKVITAARDNEGAADQLLRG